MARKVVKTKKYNVSAKLKLDVGLEIEALSLEQAVVKAKELKIGDFIDFGSLGLEHNDSDDPHVYSVWESD